MTWDSDLTTTWDTIPRGYPNAYPLLLKAVAGTPQGTFWQVNGNLVATEPRVFRLERTQLRLEDDTIRPEETKLITNVTPIVYGTTGDVLQFYIGGEFGQPGAPISWEGPYSYEIGVDTGFDCLVTCRYAAYKVETESLTPFVLTAIEFEFQGVGTD